MADVLGKDLEVYNKEKEAFLRDLKHFHETRGTPFRRTPRIGGYEVDLFLLYSLVTEQGGWIKVNSKSGWPDLFQNFKIPVKCVNASIALKQIYLRYLDRWEKVHHLGEEADRGSDDDEESRHKRWSARALHSVPTTYNYHQHNIAESTREYNALSTDLYKPSEYDRLALSLISSLPNEQDFAINVCTLLASDGKHTLKIEKHPRILDYLCAHAGVFNHGSLRKLFTYNYQEVRKHNLLDFWSNVIDSSDVLRLTDESNFTKTEEEKEEVTEKNDSLIHDVSMSDFVPSTIDLTADLDSSKSKPKNVEEAQRDKEMAEKQTDRELFNLASNIGIYEFIGQRILQIAVILRNLSFYDENIQILAKNETFLRFVLLLCSARFSNLKQVGLEILGNVSLELKMNDIKKCELSKNVLTVIENGLSSENFDRCQIITSLELLNKLSQNEQNEEILLKIVKPDVYKQICQYLTIHDVMLLIYTLECLYSLTALGEKSCVCISNIKGVLDTLISLITVEGKSYGPKACINMKLVEIVTQSSQNINNNTQNVNNNQSVVVPGSASVVSGKVGGASTVTGITGVNKANFSPSFSMSLTPSTPQRPVAVVPQRLLAASPGPAPSPPQPAQTGTITPQQLVQQQHAHQQAIQENEQFALAWIRATYEPSLNGKVDHQELYKHYINSCAKIGRRGVIAPLHFPRCVRSVFGGSVGPNPSKPVNTNEPQFYDGIKARAVPLVINVQTTISTPIAPTPVNRVVRKVTTKGEEAGCAPISPILKAQLSGAPKTDPASQVMAHPHLSQALLGTPGSSKEPQNSSSSLIKSLLANKVNEQPIIGMKSSPDCQNVVQVVARQQRMLAQQDSKTTKPVKLNGARQLFSTEEELSDCSVSSTTAGLNSNNVSLNAINAPPPPLAPLTKGGKQMRIDNDDSNSIASSHIGVSSTEENDNSLTSFEGILLNGVPNIDKLNEDSNSKEELIKTNTNVITKDKPLMLADLLEKKIDKEELPTLNGVLGNLVENHIKKAINNEMEDSQIKQGIKRPALSEEKEEVEAKKPHLATNGKAASPTTDSVSSSNGEPEVTGTVSTAAAKLFADIAADILEDEQEEELMQQEAQPAVVETPPQLVQNNVFVDANQQVLINQPRIIVSQPQMNQPRQMGQIILPQGQIQLVSSAQGGQYVLQTGGGGNYVVAQTQTAVVHGQPQTVLVAQTPQNQGTGTKTIIILQQQPSAAQATHHQKIVVTPQGQQVVVTQVPRPQIQTSTIKQITPTAQISTNGVSLVEKPKIPEEKPKKPKIIRDLTSPYVCEWGDCTIETKFTTANQVYMHVCEAHCPESLNESICLWDNCDNMKRKRFSLMTHLFDKHCNNEAMKNNLVRRKQQSQGTKVEPPAPPPSTNHPGYAPDAALHAIKRHALEFVNPKELQDDNEGPVTKSIRLTASLILRNLVIYSSTCRRYLKIHEPHLANVALSNVESSRTIAQVLHDMNDINNR